MGQISASAALKIICIPFLNGSFLDVVMLILTDVAVTKEG